MTNLDSILKSRDITLPTKVILGKKKIIKGIQTEKEEVKLSLSADHPKDSIKKLLEQKITAWVCS